MMAMPTRPMILRAIQYLVLRQTKYLQRIHRDDRDVLLAVLSGVRDRVRVALSRQLRDPELLAVLRIERANATVVRRADDDDAARCGNRAGAAAAAGVLLPVG